MNGPFKGGIPTWLNTTNIVKPMKPAYDPLPRTRDAGIWANSSYTKADHLFNVLSYFIEQGWGPDYLWPFVKGVMPEATWTNNPIPHGQMRRRQAYSPVAQAIIGGYYTERR